MAVVITGSGIDTPAGGLDAADLTGVLPALDGSALTGIGSSVTLLGTLATTSGTSVTLSSLDLTDYSTLYFVIDDVHASSASVGARIEINSWPMSRLFGSSPAQPSTGLAVVDLTTGFGISAVDTLQAGSYFTATGYGFDSGLSTASTSITFTVSADSFGNGSIKVYGVS